MKKLDSLCLVRFSFVFFLLSTLSAGAQQVESGEETFEISEDTATVVSALDIVPEILEEQMDSPVSSFLLKDRFQGLQNEIPLRYNEHSHRYVDFFVDKRPSFTRRMLETKDVYFPIFEKSLSAHKLPEELKYLPLIESGLDPRIISRAGAGGLWQFMRATGREFGLQQNPFIDERFHPEKATEAACRYLRQLHNIFGDWEMALAAYNCGPGNIRRAIRRTGRSDFWGIYPVLPKETRNYVPQFVAMVYLMNYAKDHGLAPSELKLIPVADTLRVDGYLNLNTFTSLVGMSMDDIYELNPHLVGNHIPQSSENFNLKIPATKAALISDDLVCILDSSSKAPLNGAAGIHLADSRTVKDGYEVVNTTLRHTVKGGQTLSSIARQHGVTVAQLKAWNRLKGTTLKKGQRLVVQKSVRKAIPAARTQPETQLAAKKQPEEVKDTVQQLAVNTVSEVTADESDSENPQNVLVASNAHMTESMLLERQASRLQNQTGERASISTVPTKTVPVQESKKAEVKPSGTGIVHTIQRGETLIEISKKYKVEVDDIIKENELSGTKLVAGRKLQITTGAPVKTRNRVDSKDLYHVVQAGDTLWAISKRYGLSVDRIKKTNNIKGSALKTGMKILISG